MRPGPDFYNYQGAQSQAPNNPPPEPVEEPTHDVPTFPEHDPPPPTQTALGFDGATATVSPGRATGPGEHEIPNESEDDVDDDDLDPQVPHSPPDGKKRIIFDENGVAG